MNDIAISLADGPYHSGSAQALYHPNHQVMQLCNPAYVAYWTTVRSFVPYKTFIACVQLGPL